MKKLLKKREMNIYIYFFSSEFDLGFLIRGYGGHRCHIQFKLSQKAG